MVKKKNTIKHLVFSSRSRQLLVVLAVAALGTILLPLLRADTAYSCNSGDSLSGNKCTHKSTYNASYNSSYYYCPNGGNQGSSQDSTCTTTYTGSANGRYYCPSSYDRGTLYSNGENGKCWYSYPMSSNPNNRCPYDNGQIGKDGNGNYVCYFGAQNGQPEYSCNSGDSGGGTSSTCQHTYNATYSSGYYYCKSGDSLSGSTCTHTTTYTAQTSSSQSGGNSGGGSTIPVVTSSSSDLTTGGGSGESKAKVTTASAQPPGTPGDFTATVVASKLVNLSWSASIASAGIKEYDIDRSTDGTNWVGLTSVTDTSYIDDSTDFSTTYTYRVSAVDNHGDRSDYATVQATTTAFESSSDKITSDDRIVTVKVAANTFSVTYSCAIASDDNLSHLPAGQVGLAGPYSVLCVTSDGTVLKGYNSPLQVTMDLSKVAKNYGGIHAGELSGSKWQSINSKYDSQKQQLTFSLIADKSFAAFGSPHKSAVGVIATIFLILVLLGGGGFGFVVWRRHGFAISGGGGAVAELPDEAYTPTAQEEFEQAVSKPNCTHLGMARQVQPSGEGCYECTLEHKHWKALRICLVCGHVGCSDDSPEQHAMKHFQETGHPIIYAYNDPSAGNIGWCYIDQTYI